MQKLSGVFGKIQITKKVMRLKSAIHCRQCHFHIWRPIVGSCYIPTLDAEISIPGRVKRDWLFAAKPVIRNAQNSQQHLLPGPPIGFRRYFEILMYSFSAMHRGENCQTAKTLPSPQFCRYRLPASRGGAHHNPPGLTIREFLFWKFSFSLFQNGNTVADVKPH